MSQRAMLATMTVIVLAVSAALFADKPQHPKPIVESFTGKVISIAEGDTITVLRDDKPVRVRLEGIDAPEVKQEHSAKSTHALSELIKGKSVFLQVTGTDKEGHLLAIVRVNDEVANERLVGDGWAWHYKEYNADPKLAELEVKAREKKIGLWAHANAIPPWEYRDISRKAAELAKAPPVAPIAVVIPRAPPPVEPVPKAEAKPTLTHWLNTETNVRHRASCRWFGKTKKGRPCTGSEGSACGICKG